MQKKSKDFPEIPGESLIERKKRFYRWRSANAYRERRQAGFCGRCGKNRPKPGCAGCTECLKVMAKRNNWRDHTPGICSKCAKVPPEEGKSCCRPCLDRQKELNRRRRNTSIGNWMGCVRRATLDLANGRSHNGKAVYKSKWLDWTHFDFVKGHKSPFDGANLDHIIPLACAETLDGQVDQEFSRLVTNLANLQYISHQANVLKAQNQDKQAIQKAKELRERGIHGAELFNKLWAEFAWPDRTGKEA